MFLYFERLNSELLFFDRITGLTRIVFRDLTVNNLPIIARIASIYSRLGLIMGKLLSGRSLRSSPYIYRACYPVKKSFVLTRLKYNHIPF
jgi:hypothetical protein